VIFKVEIVNYEVIEAGSRLSYNVGNSSTNKNIKKERPLWENNKSV
jgi:hypothetical protein